jgi:hypothetical protein
MRRTTISAGLAASLLAVAGLQLPHEALAGSKSVARKADARKTGNANKKTFTPPNPVRPPSPVLPPSPVKR